MSLVACEQVVAEQGARTGEPVEPDGHLSPISSG
jgi:hypothetical protein